MYIDKKIWYFGYLLLVVVLLYIIIVYIDENSYQIGFISILVAIISIIIALNSDRLINSLSTNSFRRILGQIEDKRLELGIRDLLPNPSSDQVNLVPRILSMRAVNTWKCFTYVDEALDILIHADINPRLVSRFLNLINNYSNEVLIVRNEFIIEETHHLISIYERVYDMESNYSKRYLERCQYTRRKEESYEPIHNLLGIPVHTNIDINYLRDYNSLIKDLISQDRDNLRFNHKFITINDIINHYMEER